MWFNVASWSLNRCGRHDDLLFSALDCGLRGLGLIGSDRVTCVVFLGKRVINGYQRSLGVTV